MSRRIGSIKTELLKKSREAALAAVQIFNNPNINFKSEAYVVLMIIAWTYLLHAYFKSNNIEYRYYQQKEKKRIFDKTKYGAYKHWELERCLNEKKSPLNNATTSNLKFLIGLRHEIEHQMTTRIDDILSARFQACCLNYNHYIKELFGNDYSIEKHLSFSLQFSSISTEQKSLLEQYPNLPANIESYIIDFDEKLPDEDYSSSHFAYRILFIPKLANRKGQADRVIEFINSNSPLANSINKEYAVIKETEKKKYLPKQIIEIMRNEGYSKFTMYEHTKLWKELDARNSSNDFGTFVADNNWHWYEKWLDKVRKYCADHKSKFV